jgi:peptidoglycan/LPS O-acetylase OafA/YrhL
VVILHCALATSPVSKLLGSALPRWIGVRSYAIYLYGLTLLESIPLVTHLPLHEVAPLAILATAVAVGLSYRFVEAPIRRRGREWLANRAENAVGQLPNVGDVPP